MEVPGKHTLEVVMTKKKEAPSVDKDQAIKDLENSVRGLLESYDLTMRQLESANAGLAAGVVKGFFHGEISRGNTLIERIKKLRYAGHL